MITNKSDVELRELDPESKPTALSDFTGPIAQRWWLIVLLMITAVAAAYFAGARQTIYEASSTVMLSPVAAGTYATPTALNEIITGDTLVTEVAKAGNLSMSTAALKTMIHAEQVGGPNIVTITVSGPKRAPIAKIANLAADRFVGYAKVVDPASKKTAMQLDMARETLKWLDQLLYEQRGGSQAKTPFFDTRHLDDEIKATNEKLTNAEGSQRSSAEKALEIFALNQRLTALEDRRLQAAEKRISLLSTKLSYLEQDRTLSESLAQSAGTKVLTAAVAPTAPASPNITANLLSAALAALVAGCGLAIALSAAADKGDAR